MSGLQEQEINKEEVTKRMKGRCEIPKLRELDKTDQAIIERFFNLVLKRYGGIIRYDLEKGEWLIFDGNEWEIDKYGEIKLLARIMAASLIAKESGDVNTLQSLQKIEKKLRIDERINKARKKGVEA
jgi:hypothetical protein